MNKKNAIKKTAAVLLGLALGVGATGCNFIVTDNEKDLAQTVASVDITDSLAKDEKYKDYADDVSAILENLTTDISKRDLVAYFLSTGYQYVESYGYTYADTFNMLLDGLISREIMIQYAVAYYLEQGKVSKEDCDKYIADQLAALDESDAKQKKEKELLEEHPEVLTLKYFLTENGADAEDYDRAVYSLKKSLNNSLDSIEGNYITAEEHEHGESRTLPTGAGEEKEDYYAKPENYDVYTGRNTLDSCGEYEKVEGSTAATRQKAYNAFLANLEGYNLIQKSGNKVEDTRDVTLIDYYYVELGSALGQALISKYYEDLEETIAEDLTKEYVSQKYNDLYAQQEKAYKNNPEAFAAALDEASADTFILYGLKDFGFVYNILVPFSTSQKEAYTRAQNNGLSQDQLYNVRKSLLSEVRGEDQRGSWISMDPHLDHSYSAGGTSFKFFRDNIQNTERYKELTHYQGVIPYYGKVELVDGDFESTPSKLKLDSVITELTVYSARVGEKHGTTYRSEKQSSYEEANMNTKYVDDDGEVMYDKFVYEKGKIEFAEDLNPSDYFVKGTAYYDFVSVVNEVTFAYSTDPGSLNSYMGYAISPYSTNFMKEFEYAAQEAVKAENGVGSYYVVPTDYGWHIIVSTFVFEKDGAVYDGYNHDDAVGEKMIEGSFSNRFYESLKSSAASNYTNEVQSGVLNDYNNDDCVTRYEKRYKDLLEMDS